VRLADRYEVGAVLGVGGMGEVRDGHDLRLGRPVAIKLLRADLARQASAREAFEREAQAAATLMHPRVVGIFDTGEEDGVPYIVMERLPGRTLEDEIARGPLDDGTVRRLALQVLAALQAAHDAGIVHRDVKPGNILLTESGDAKVSDFGIAKSLADDHTTDVVMGTAAYVAPERLTGSPATPASDLYSLGVVLYEAVSGATPFAGEHPVAVLRAAQEGAAAPLSDDIDAALRTTIERAMARDPTERFAGASEMAATLEEQTTEATEPLTSAGGTQRLPSAALPTPPRRRASRPRLELREGLKRHTAAVVALAIAAVAVVAVIIALSSSGGDLHPALPPTSTPVETIVADPTQPPLPEPLADAFADLERAIQE
jgi:eukaryotic-like serine/threonine-protein kinase